MENWLWLGTGMIKKSRKIIKYIANSWLHFLSIICGMFLLSLLGYHWQDFCVAPKDHGPLPCYLLKIGLITG